MMMRQIRRNVRWVAACVVCWTAVGMAAIEEAALPAGVQAVWDMSKAYKETTATRERICINGLWRWQPAGAESQRVPEGNWGYFKVPGSWPGVTDYMQKDSQTVHAHPAWADRNLSGLTAAWYE